MADLRDLLAEFGAEPTALRLLDDESPELLPYATLMTARRNGDAGLGRVEAVYEWQDAPLVFLVDADSVASDKELQRTRRLLAMRGDAPYLGVVAPGSLRVYRIALDRKSLRQARVGWGDDAGARKAVFARLANGRPQAGIHNRTWISDIVLRLLNGSMTRLIDLDASHEDAISLVGRALFTRFLGDRGLLPEGMSAPETTAGLFDTRAAAEATSRWLDDTFNGDLLPLSADTFRRLPAEGYGVLGDVLRRAPGGQLMLGWKEQWGYLDFAHIPVGVLSQAYELYQREHAPIKQKREGGYFTPRPIAELMVRAAFRALGRRGAAKSARVLDPAVGAGIFLLTAFRELVAEHWAADGRRPDTDVLRRILYDQLVGFDINEGALRYAALGLYLLSIELDPDPRPVDKLGFDVLRGTVLHQVKSPEEEEGATLGSLGPGVGDEHRARYDLVIGNPPWASSTKLPEWQRVLDTTARIATGRGIGNKAPPLPNEVLDLPFVWRALEWAKPDGQIAFALHARLLFAQGEGMPTARQALFEALDVTSVVNGAELRQTKVWPHISAPFCVLFGTNRKPGLEAGFRLVSPRIEGSLNQAGGMRIDAANAEVVASRQLAETPDLLKVLFRGTKADLGVLQRIRAQDHPTLEAFWKERFGTYRGGLRGSGNGYQKLRATSTVSRRGGDGLRGVDASYLRGRRQITTGPFASILVDSSLLERFEHERIHRRRSIDLFVGPQAIVHESPPKATARISVAVSDDGVVYNTSFHGYCAGKDADGALLVRYIALVLGSRLATWFALVTSGRFGVERDVVEKIALDRLPLPRFDQLTAGQREDIRRLIGGLDSGAASWEEADAWVMRLYGLGERDSQVVSDTLAFNLPFAANRRSAQAPPGTDERYRFCEVLRDELEPWCRRFGSKVGVYPVRARAVSPWHAIAVRTGRRHAADAVTDDDWAGLLRAADEAAATEILLEDGPDGLLIGRLAQRRYWSKTQARLLARRIAWSHVGLLKRRADA